MTMRLFVAVTPPESAVEDLDAFLSVRRDAGPFRWTTSDQWHLTLAFMPSAPDRVLDDLVERLGRAAHRRSSFEVSLRGGGAFPNAARAKVLFADVVDDGEHLPHLATGVRASCAKAGAAPEGGPFRAHLTLARVGRPQDVTPWVRLLDAYTGPSWAVGEIQLVESHLGEGPRKRPRHVVLDSFALGG